jgi:alkylation response protein AidB-like acyl-CoA dehydrogenase
MTGLATQADDVLARCGPIAQALRDRGPEIESLGRLPDDVVAALRGSGVFGLWLPAELGGAEADPGDVVTVLELLAEADAATGWCAAIGMASNCIASYLPQSVARELYATGAEITGGSVMMGGQAKRRDENTFVVSGQWSFGSGAQHSDWVVGGVLVVDDKGSLPEPRIVVMPAAALTYDASSWQVAGLQGTASVDYEVTGLSVPVSHTIELAALTTWPAGTMWQLPLFSLILPVMAAVPLGIARRAISELISLTRTKTPYRSSQPLAERATAQERVAQAQALVDSGHAYLVSALQELRDAVDYHRVPTVAQRASARLAAVQATDNAARAVELAYRTGGTDALYQHSALQRALRDVNATTQHFALNANGFESIGRILFGFDPDTPL